MKRDKLLSIIKSALLYILTGLICGVVGTLFSKGVAIVTNIRFNNDWLLYFLPLAGIASVTIYKLLKVTNMGTNQVIESTQDINVISPKLAPAIFLASLLSHLCGASIGREGAALQLGGSSVGFIAKIFKINKTQEKILIYCGMAGVFSSVFGTPLAAAFFALEIVFVGHIYFKAVIPVFLTSILSYITSSLLGAHPERFSLSTIPHISFPVLWKILLLGLLVAILGIIFCLSIKYFEKIFKRLFKSTYIRIIIGGIIIVLLSICLGTYDYNGAGINIIEEIFNNNQFVPAAFVFKMLFTCISVGAGFKGGEIVPTLFIGATFGALAGALLGLPIAFSAAICMIALFCSVTNCLLASIFLAAELFSGAAIGYIIIAVVISYCLSSKISLYSAQKTDGFKNLF